jgi:hypothetical protein
MQPLASVYVPPVFAYPILPFSHRWSCFRTFYRLERIFTRQIRLCCLCRSSNCVRGYFFVLFLILSTLHPSVKLIPYVWSLPLIPACRLEYAHWLFHWAFVSTAATIVSGAVAQRIRLEAYLTFAVLLSVLTCAFQKASLWPQLSCRSPRVYPPFSLSVLSYDVPLPCS